MSGYLTNTAANSENLNAIRESIDAIDRRMAVLYEARLNCATAVARYKYARHQPIFDAVREKAVIDKNVSRLKNPEAYGHYYRAFLQHLMDQCKDLEATLIAEMDAAEAEGYPRSE
ncbi:chorismate mutase [Pseudoramibacter sp. HA2172]|uniref:chorismate mutase n=1 Tax=Pseudoramibacter faecis TaxID=3108534 RepID=UPI002E78FAAC|nr:chorismate mutase [Pseudoramibacter sp. HA2172]